MAANKDLKEYLDEEEFEQEIMPDEEQAILAGEEPEMTEEDKSVWRMSEDDLLDALFAAADFINTEDAQKNIEIERNGRVFFTFRVKPLSEADWTRIRKANTKRIKNKATGLPMNGDFDIVRYRSQVIYEATVAEDRMKLWDNKRLWNKYNLVTGIDAVDILLLAGEKQAVFDVIDDMNGYKDPDEVEAEAVEISKN